jgi:hypothetical protein
MKILDFVQMLAGSPQLFSVERIVSASGLVSALRRGDPKENSIPFMYVNDEVSGLFRDIADIRNNHARAAAEKLMEAFTSPASKIAGNAKAKKENSQIVCPYLTFHGTSTIAGFFADLDPETMRRGLIGRTLIFQSNGKLDKVWTKEDFRGNKGSGEPTQELKNLAAVLAQTMNGQPQPVQFNDITDTEIELDESGFMSDPVLQNAYGQSDRPNTKELTFSEEALEALAQLRNHLLASTDDLLEMSEEAAESLNRGLEIVSKLALIHQVCKDIRSEEIELESFQWGAAVAYHALGHVLVRYLDQPEKGFEAQWLELIEQATLHAGLEGLTEGWVKRLAFKIDRYPAPRIRDQILDEALRDEENHFDTVRSGGKIRFYHKSFLTPAG